MAALGFTTFSPNFYSLFFLLLLLFPVFHRCHAITTDRRSLLASGRRSGAVNRIPSCDGFLDPLQCNRSPNCRWCRSQSIDDLCFRKSEAWRLPSQVFVCDQTPPSSSRSAN